MRIEIIDIDPAQASQWLGLNSHNRKLRHGVVDTYALDMREGRWHLTGDPVKLNGNVLLDGQHRLHAIVKAGVVIPMAVAFDVDSAAQEVVDIGASRFARDILELRGIPNASTVAAVASMVAGWECGQRWALGSGGGNLLSRIAIADRAMDQRILESVSRIWGDTSLTSSIPPRILGFCHWLLTGANRDRGEVFMRSLIDGTDTQSVIHVLRERLIRERLNAERGRTPGASYIVAVIIAGWNAWRRGGGQGKIQLPKNNEFPEPTK